MKNQTYTHYKGGKYTVIGLGYDSETHNRVVIYHVSWDNEELWVRPLDEFLGMVETEEGKIVPRFKADNSWTTP